MGFGSLILLFACNRARVKLCGVTVDHTLTWGPLTVQPGTLASKITCTTIRKKNMIKYIPTTKLTIISFHIQILSLQGDFIMTGVKYWCNYPEEARK